MPVLPSAINPDTQTSISREPAGTLKVKPRCTNICNVEEGINVQDVQEEEINMQDVQEEEINVQDVQEEEISVQDVQEEEISVQLRCSWILLLSVYHWGPNQQASRAGGDFNAHVGPEGGPKASDSQNLHAW